MTTKPQISAELEAALTAAFDAGVKHGRDQLEAELSKHPAITGAAKNPAARTVPKGSHAHTFEQRAATDRSFAAGVSAEVERLKKMRG